MQVMGLNLVSKGWVMDTLETTLLTAVCCDIQDQAGCFF